MFRDSIDGFHVAGFAHDGYWFHYVRNEGHARMTLLVDSGFSNQIRTSSNATNSLDSSSPTAIQGG